MRESELLERRFEEQRPRLRGIAYRMLGSIADADDAVQETWLRLSRSDTDVVENLNAWLTTIVGRVSLNMLRSRRVRREDSLEVYVPDPVVDPPHTADPEHAAVVADSVGLALLVVLETLTPDERLAFVLHDVFAVPFDDIAHLLDRSPVAARKLASRARRRIQDDAPAQDVAPAAQRAVVDAFFAAARSGDFEALVGVLHSDVVLRADFGPAGPAARRTEGAAEVARRALLFASPQREVRPVTVNGTAGAAVVEDGRLQSVMGFTFLDGRIASITVLADRQRLDGLDLTAVTPGGRAGS